jgi:hypothetical protein
MGVALTWTQLTWWVSRQKNNIKTKTERPNLKAIWMVIKKDLN